MVKIYISIGSNKGDRQKHIVDALKYLQQYVFILKISSFIVTAPVENVKGGYFLNGVVEAKTTLPPKQLLSFLQQVEVKIGREAFHKKGDEREIDLDIIFYGAQVLKREELIIPHPRYSNREFVLTPLIEIAPTLTDPVKKCRVDKLRNQ